MPASSRTSDAVKRLADRALGLQADAGALVGRSKEGPPTVHEAASPEARA
jgi:hypothetical protein